MNSGLAEFIECGVGRNPIGNVFDRRATRTELCLHIPSDFAELIKICVGRKAIRSVVCRLGELLELCCRQSANPKTSLVAIRREIIIGVGSIWFDVITEHLL